MDTTSKFSKTTTISRPDSTSKNSNSFTKNNAQQYRRPAIFAEYMSREDVQRGLKRNELIQGTIRINQRNFEEAFVDNPAGTNARDILVVGVADRNRALHGDTVAIRLKPRCNWIIRGDIIHEKKSFADAPISQSNDIIPDVDISQLDISISDTTQVSGDNTDLSMHRYGRQFMIEIAKQSSTTPQQIKTLECLSQEQLLLSAPIQNLSVTPSSTTVVAPSSNNIEKSTTIGGRNRVNYRFVRDHQTDDDHRQIDDSCLQKTAEIVYIIEPKHMRCAVGQLKPMADANRNWALFSPNDSRMPRMMIPANEIPVGFFDRPQDFAKYLFVARLIDWQMTSHFARGQLHKSIGMAGDIAAETEALLMCNGVDANEFPPEILDSLPSLDTEWKIDAREFEYRRDFRDQIVFTIDPKTARDLDDALHIRQLDDDCWEVGVHIADVAHFVRVDTALDQCAADRATSVYLVHKVIPMLPRILCEQLCSLNPGIDRLTFSVVWKLNKRAEIVDEWFGRSIIRSCCKLAYEHAQDFIDRELSLDALPTIYDNRSSQELCEKVRQLHRLALMLKAKRIENGALRLEVPKLSFSLDTDSGLPNGCAVYQLDLCTKIGYPVDASSAALLAKSLSQYFGYSPKQMTIAAVLTQLIMRSMQLAVYFCSGTIEDENEYRHYALSVPFYTHFTSPIRRYPDIIVHRLLAASLDYCEPPAMTTAEVEKVAQHCNDRKVAAKTISDASAEMFFGVFVRECGPIEERAVVMNVYDAAFDVLFINYGLIRRVYTNRLDLAHEPTFVEGPPPVMTLVWNNGVGTTTADHRSPTNDVQTISICSIVTCILAPIDNEPTKYQVTIKRGDDQQLLETL